MIIQTEKEVADAMKADPQQWAHNYILALKAIEELEERLLGKKQCSERSKRYLANKGMIN